MKPLWTWGGIFFGYRDGDSLWTHDGKHVGQFSGDEIFDSDGRYLGELRNENRLITAHAKKHLRRASFTPFTSRGGIVPYVNYVGYVMYVGYEDFPDPTEF